jgi:hypothetical protein
VVAVAAIVAFFALGIHKRVTELAINRMAEFLLGGGGITEDTFVVESVIGSESDDEPAPDAEMLPKQMGAAEAVAALMEGMATAVSDSLMAAEAAPGTYADQPDSIRDQAGRTYRQAYTASYLRDPFRSLIVAGETEPTRLLNVATARMVGSVWGEGGAIALLEDDVGRSYALKAGDKVVNGRVTSVTPVSVVFSITVFGLTRTVTLELADEGEW